MHAGSWQEGPHSAVWNEGTRHLFWTRDGLCSTLTLRRVQISQNTWALMGLLAHSLELSKLFRTLFCLWDMDVLLFVVVKVACVSWSSALWQERRFNLRTEKKISYRLLTKQVRQGHIIHIIIYIVPSQMILTARNFSLPFCLQRMTQKNLLKVNSNFQDSTTIFQPAFDGESQVQSQTF